jgi:DMSO/TMAO reductase YedYZ molybdopterin-dependent catalytic subunit
MQLIFLTEITNTAGQHVFGHDDMRNYLPEDNWHHFWDGGIQYPSSNGISIKYISKVNIYTEPPEPWGITVTSAVTTTPVSQSWFENALACHEVVTWTDSSDDVWSGLPLWWLLGLADDEVVHGMGSFNDALAREGYDIEVQASDGYTRSFRSEDVRRSSGYIVANLINGKPLTDSFPLRLVGSEITSGRDRVGMIERINLLNIPDIETWELELSGAQDYTMSQAEFESAVYCPDIGHSAVYTEEGSAVNPWKGLPLWVLVGWVDDANQHGPDAFNDELAELGYDVRVIAADGYSYTFPISDVVRNDNIIVANTINDLPLSDNSYPLRLVGSDLTSGNQEVKKIAKIELLNLPWTLELSGADVYTMTRADFEEAVPSYGAVYTKEVELNGGDTAIYEWKGLPLWRLAGWVDDDNQGPDAFNDNLADLGYDVRVIAADGYSYTFPISDVVRNDNIIVANTINDLPLSDNSYPLRLVGSDLTPGKQIKQVVRIELADLPRFVYLPLVIRNN